MSKQRINQNHAFLDFERFKYEIEMDTYEFIVKSLVAVARKTLIFLGNNEMHHIVKYYQRNLLNALYFKDTKMMYDYQEWLYRVHYNRGTDLDFFRFLIESFQRACEKYIDMKICLEINEYCKYVLDKHEFLKSESSKKKLLIDHIEEATHFSEVLVSGDKQKAYELCKSKVNNLDQFLDYYNNIISNAMKNVGYQWEIGKVSVAKEHIASNTLNDICIKVLDTLEDKESNGDHIFLSSAPNESHGQGISIASRVYEKLGYKVTNLGVNIPAKDIKKAIIEFQADYIILAATLQTSLLDIAYLVDDIAKEKELFRKSFKIGIAGGAFENMIHPARTFRADFYMKHLEDVSKF